MKQRLIPLLCLLVLPMGARAVGEEDKLAEQIEDQGGLIERDAKAPGKPVVGVDLRGISEIQAGQIKKLAGFAKLRVLHLWGLAVTDEMLDELAGLSALKDLDLDATRVTDAGLAKLAKLGSLRNLSLWKLPITDAGLKHLGGMTKLEELNLGNTRITDAGLKELAKLDSLRKLELVNAVFLRETRVTEAGVAGLRKAFPRCEVNK